MARKYEDFDDPEQDGVFDQMPGLADDRLHEADVLLGGRWINPPNERTDKPPAVAGRTEIG